MRTKSSISTFVALAFSVFVLSPSCQREVAQIETEVVHVEQGESVLSFRLDNPGFDESTKSVITDPTFESGIKSVLVLVVGSDGHWKKAYATTVGGLQQLTIRADGVTSYTVYAFANMGDVTIPTGTGGEIRPDLFAYTLPDSFSGLNSTGLPMAGSIAVPAATVVPNGVTNITVPLNRLLSKVVVTIDKGGMLSGASDGSALAGGSLKVCQVAKVVRPFAATANRRAQSSSEVYSAANSDYYDFTVTDRNNLVNENIVLYIAENRQGNGSGSTQAGKTPATGRENLVTYLEYTAAKNGASDGVSGNMTYRVYLGENVTNNFDVIGDKVYRATLNLSWLGMWEGPWRVTSSGWADTRALVISKTANSAVPMGTGNTKADAEKVRKTTPTAFYMNFFPNGTGASVSHGRKNLESWPYGWKIFVDGVALPSGTSGIIKNASNQDFIAWNYNAVDDCLSMETVPGAPSSPDIHTIQFKTLDGLKSSEVEYFVTSVPFEYNWVDSGNPNHVAQRGILQARDADTHIVDPQGIFHVKDGYSSKVRLTDNNDGTAKVELIDGFTAIGDAIYIEDADGDRHCDVPLEARIPWWECTSLGTTFVDKPQTLVFSYFPVDESGNKVGSTPMQINKSTGVNAGLNLSFDLTEECIVPTTSSIGGKLGFDRNVNTEGRYELFTYIATYAGLSPSDDTFDVDNAVIGMTKSSKATQLSTFRAYNPWKFVSNTVVPGPLMNDYTLYHTPARSGPSGCRVGWDTNPSDAPAETTSKTVQVRNVVISNPRNLKLDAKFGDGSGYIGEKIATGTPGTVSPTYTETTLYQLHVRLTNAVNFDWVALGNYLYYDLAHYIPGSVWVNPTATDAIKKAEITSLFDECSNDVVISSYGTEAEVWAQAASGVTKSNPTVLQGIEFFTTSETIGSNWDLTYSMNGLTSNDIKTHGAGQVDVILKIVNPYDKTGVTLDKKVSEAFMRLHLWVWASVTEVTQIHPSYSSGSSQGWAYKATPYVFTDGKPIAAISSLFTRNIFKPQAETYTTASTTYLRGYAANLSMGGDYYGNKGEATWQFRNDNVFQADWSDAKKRSELMSFLSATSGNSIFEFRMPVNQEVTWPDFYGPGQSYKETIEGLNSILGGDKYFYRQSPTRLYYDPTGPEYKYVYGSTAEGTNKLFVIYIGETSLAVNPYFFDPARGYVNP